MILDFVQIIQQHILREQGANDEEGTPLPDIEYILTDTDGTEYPGITNENGHSATIFGKVGENLHIRLLASTDDDEEMSEEA